jgi:hypothetical protein
MAGGNTNFDISTFKPEYSIQQSISGGRISVVPEPVTLPTVLIALPLGRRLRRGKGHA